MKHQPSAGERTHRIADFIRDEVARILQRQMRDPRVGMISVTDVQVSRDLAFADIYVSSLQATDAAARETLVATLNKAAGWVRTELARTHTMRTTPKPRFHYDESMVDGPRLDRLIEDAVAEDRSRHPEDADEQA